MKYNTISNCRFSPPNLGNGVLVVCPHAVFDIENKKEGDNDPVHVAAGAPSIK
jgi:hypothetical protein